jgi:hypothetical protein
LVTGAPLTASDMIFLLPGGAARRLAARLKGHEPMPREAFVLDRYPGWLAARVRRRVPPGLRIARRHGRSGLAAHVEQRR